MQAKPAPGTAEWVEQDGKLTRRYAGRASDERASKSPQQQQLLDEIRTIADRLASQANARESNSNLLTRLALDARIFAGLLAHDSKGIVERLPRLYVRSVGLAVLLEVDDAAQREGFDAPLAPAMRADLLLLVRSTAPWLRGYPYVVAQDAKEARGWGADQPYDQAEKLVGRMLADHVVSDDDADDLVPALKAGEGRPGTPPGAQGARMGRLGFADASNLLVTALRRIAATQAGLPGLPGETEELTQRMARTLAAAHDHVISIAREMQPDLRLAAESVLREVETAGGAAVAVKRILHEDEIPPDVDDAAAALISRGFAPPEAWWPHIKQLVLTDLNPAHVVLLSGLTSL